MDVFRHRGIALGCGAFLVSLYASYYFNSLTKILLITSSLSAFILLVVLYLILKKKSMLDKIIKYAPLFILVILAMLISIFSFGVSQRAEKYIDSQGHEIVGEIKDVHYESEYESLYILKIEEIDNERESVKVLFTFAGNGLNVGDKIKASITFTPFEKTSVGYDKEKTYLEKGITFNSYTDKIEVLEKGNRNLTFFQMINHKLSEPFYENMEIEDASLYSALLLGNTKELDDALKRDCQRVGVSHALSLSGMHITILATLVGFLLGFIPFLKRISRNLIIISLIILFIGITGFSASAVRAGLMMILYYLIKTVGSETDNITSLFLSVTIICALSPYSVFSVSLALSFLAMLGCLVSVRFFYKSRLRKIRPRFLNFILFSLVTTLFVIGFTLPVVFNVFGSFSILTPISNLIIIPFFTVLIYLAPFLLLCSGVPYLSGFLFFVGERLASWLIFIINRIASLENIMVHTYSVVQIVGTVAIFVSLMLLMLSMKKHFKGVLILLGASVIIFASGTIINYTTRMTSTYVTTYNYKSSDFVAIERENNLTLVDASTTTQGVREGSLGLIDYLHYSEVENYIICDYSYATDMYFNMVASNVKVRNLYLPKPLDNDENNTYKRILKVAEEERIKVKELSSELYLDEIRIEFLENNHIERSKRRCVSFDVSIDNKNILYLGSGSYEIFDYFTRKKAYYADAVIFGAYGPTYKKPYYYKMPYADKIVFYGNAKNFASEALLFESKDKAVEDDGLPIKFKLKKRALDF